MKAGELVVYGATAPLARKGAVKAGTPERPFVADREKEAPEAKVQLGDDPPWLLGPAVSRRPKTGRPDVLPGFLREHPARIEIPQRLPVTPR